MRERQIMHQKVQLTIKISLNLEQVFQRQLNLLLNISGIFVSYPRL